MFVKPFKIVLILLALTVFTGCVSMQRWDRPVSQQYADAETAYLNGDYRRAVKLFDRYTAGTGTEYEALSSYWRGMSLLQMGDFRDAANEFLAALENEPPRFYLGRTLLGLGRARMGYQDFTGAEANLSRLLSEAPEVVPTGYSWFQLGLARIRQGKWDDAVRALETAISECRDDKLANRAAEMVAFAGQGGFTVQVGAYSRKSLADKEAERLRKKDYQVSVIEFPRKNERLYGVCIGLFADYREAQLAAGRIRGSGAVRDAVVKP